jgi:transcriptional regulator with XRE-family HTH domain
VAAKSESVRDAARVPAAAPTTVAKPGAVLRAQRRKHGWTLAEVSARTGLPLSTLSKIENDKMSLTFDKLLRLSSGLGVDISALFNGETSEHGFPGGSGRRSIIRAGEGKAIETPNYSHLYPAWELLNKRIIPIVAEAHARSLEEFGELIRHPGEEYAFVIEGEVDLYTSLYAPVRLKAGDSIYFDSGMGHAYIAVGEGPCRILSLNSTPETQLIAASAGQPRAEAPRRAPATPPKKKRG